MTPQTTTTLQVCADCGAVMAERPTCPTCGGALRTVTVTLEPVASAPHIKQVLFDGGQLPSLAGGDGCQKETK